MRRVAALLALVAPLTACGTSGGSEPTPSGAGLFFEPHQEGNSFSCNTCHALREPADDGFRRPGHAFDGVLERPNYKNGQLGSFRAAANSCRTDWMALDDAWQADSPEFEALVDFLAGETNGDAGALVFNITQPPVTEELMQGDPQNGNALFNQTCAICHARDGVGSDRGPPLVGARLTLDGIASAVRTSGPSDSPAYEGLRGGRMPFWSAERLSDAELADIATFVLTNEPSAPAAQGGEAAVDLARQCAPTHARVGQTAVLGGRNQVGGTATIVDDCTIRIDNFTFDGSGIDVRIYGGLDGNYDDGFGMLGSNLVNATGHFGDTITVQLPVGRTLDEVDGVSVWCIPIRVSFGEGLFE